MRSPPKRLGTCRRGAVSFLPFYITNIEYHTHHYTSLDLVITRPYASFRSPIYRSHSFISRSATLTPLEIRFTRSSIIHALRILRLQLRPSPWLVSRFVSVSQLSPFHFDSSFRLHLRLDSISSSHSTSTNIKVKENSTSSLTHS